MADANGSTTSNVQVSLKPWVSVLQIVVPVFLFILGVYIRQVDTNINTVKSDLHNFKTESEVSSSKHFDMIFKHMTNDELHSPRTLMVTKPEFAIYNELRSEQMKELREGQERIQCSLEQMINKKK